MIRTQGRIKSVYRSRGVLVAGVDVYGPRRREEWIDQLPSTTRTRATRLYDQLDFLPDQKKQAEADLLREATKHPMVGPRHGESTETGRADHAGGCRRMTRCGPAFCIATGCLTQVGSSTTGSGGHGSSRPSCRMPATSLGHPRPQGRNIRAAPIRSCNSKRSLSKPFCQHTPAHVGPNPR